MKTHKEADIKKSCAFCEHFRSFEDIYEDDLEPWEYGWCYHPDSPPYEIAGEGTTCDKFELEDEK